MADDKNNRPVYPPPDKSSVAERFTESWDFERALQELKAKREKKDDNGR